MSDTPILPPSDNFYQRVIATVFIVLLSVSVLLIVWWARHVLLLMFLSILMAIGLRTVGDWIGQRTPLSDGGALIVVLILLVLLLVAGSLALGQQVAIQLDQLIAQLPIGAAQLQSQLEQFEWGRLFLNQLANGVNWNELMMNVDRQAIFFQVTGTFSETLNIIATITIILFIAIYLALEPKTYVRGMIRLVPKSRRPRAAAVLNEMGEILQKWLLSRLVSVVVVSVITTLGLLALNMPLPLVLGLIAGLFSFVPTFGPIFAIIPALLVAVLQNPWEAFYVFILYTIVQQIDGYFLTPYIQRVTVSLPPALTVTWQLILSLFTGFLGLLLAAPLMAIGSVAVRMLYVEDVLGDYGDGGNDGDG